MVAIIDILMGVGIGFAIFILGLVCYAVGYKKGIKTARKTTLDAVTEELLKIFPRRKVAFKGKES